MALNSLRILFFFWHIGRKVSAAHVCLFLNLFQFVVLDYIDLKQMSWSLPLPGL